jgi:membrane associated rhomboid family serine protease
MTPGREVHPMGLLKTMEDEVKLVHVLFFPSLFLVVIWLLKILEHETGMDLTTWGIYPLSLKGLGGIVGAPLVHADFRHLFDNSLPLYFLSVALFYFYRKVAYRVFFLTWLITGIWVWVGGREAYHIGASGLVYGFASFLFFSGIIRGNINLLAISLLVAFVYGGLVWGIFPYDYRISWESHMGGGVTGLALAFYYRRYGPQSTRPQWYEEAENEDNEEEGERYWEQGAGEGEDEGAP